MFAAATGKTTRHSANLVRTLCVVGFVYVHGRLCTGARVGSFVHKRLHMRSHLRNHERAFVMVPKTEERSTTKTLESVSKT